MQYILHTMAIWHQSKRLGKISGMPVTEVISKTIKKALIAEHKLVSDSISKHFKSNFCKSIFHFETDHIAILLYGFRRKYSENGDPISTPHARYHKYVKELLHDLLYINGCCKETSVFVVYFIKYRCIDTWANDAVTDQ